MNAKQHDDPAAPLLAAHEILNGLSVELRKEELSLVLKADQQDWGNGVRADIYSQTERRILVRSIFSYIEAIIFGTKSLVLSDPRSAHLTEGERVLASEIAYELRSTGDVASRAAKISLTTNIRFTFRLIAKVFRSWTPLDTSGLGWECLQRSIKVRDRVTHPKHSTDLLISDEEIVDVYRALRWFDDSCNRAMIEWFADSNDLANRLADAVEQFTKSKWWNDQPSEQRSYIVSLLEKHRGLPEELSLIAAKLIEERDNLPDRRVTGSGSPSDAA